VTSWLRRASIWWQSTAVSVVASGRVGPMYAHLFAYQILADYVESCPTKACFTLYLIKDYACIFHSDIGYCLHCGCCMQSCQMLGLNPFCPEALLLLKLHTHLNTVVLCVSAFPPQIADKQYVMFEHTSTAATWSIPAHGNDCQFCSCCPCTSARTLCNEAAVFCRHA